MTVSFLFLYSFILNHANQFSITQTCQIKFWKLNNKKNLFVLSNLEMEITSLSWLIPFLNSNLFAYSLWISTHIGFERKEQLFWIFFRISIWSHAWDWLIKISCLSVRYIHVRCRTNKLTRSTKSLNRVWLSSNLLIIVLSCNKDTGTGTCTNSWQN